MKVKALTETAKIPYRAHEYDAGYDLFADDNFQIPSGEIEKIRTGIALGIPDGYVGIIKDRSSVGSKGINVLAGVIDSGYRNEVIVVLRNNTSSAIQINIGDKIAQILILPCYQKPIEEVTNLNVTDRNLNGFGSSGT